MNTENILSYLQDNREKIKLAAYFTLILALTSPLVNMLVAAWSQSALVRDVVRLRVLIDADHQAVSISVFGLYIGLLVLMTVDPKKRWQAFLLWIGTVLGLLAMQALGKFLPNVNLIARFHLVLGGMVVGMLAGGGRKLGELRDLQVLEFRRASRLIYILLAGFTVLSFLELHLVYPDPVAVYADRGVVYTGIETAQLGVNQSGLLPNLVVSVLFIATLRQFVKYDAEKQFFILGPRASGKSLFLIGAYLQALEQTKKKDTSSPLNPSNDLMSMLESLNRRQAGWIVEATAPGELKELEFQFVHGSVFPTNIQISAYDYAGEYLNRIPDALTGAIQPDEMDTTLRRLSEGVWEADTIILTVDLERFVNQEPLDISEYFSVLQSVDDTGAVIIATKADVLVDDFKDERGLEPHRYFEEFTEYVTTRLRQNKNVDALIQEAATSDIHPVYYQTKVNENGEREPMRDETGAVMTVGFDELLDEVARL